MAAFVGFIAQSNGFVFPWKLTDSIGFPEIAAAGSPFEQWDALPSVRAALLLCPPSPPLSLPSPPQP